MNQIQKENYQPLISVIVPMYNTRNYIETCLDSILIQTIKNYELILIDDYSTDGSFEFVLEKYCIKSGEKFDPRIKFFRNVKNFGTGYTVNFGIKNSVGKYVYIVDSDDAILPNTLEILITAIENFSADVIHMSRFLSVQNPNFKLGKNLPVSLESEKNYSTGLQTTNMLKRLNQIGIETHFPAWHNFFYGQFLREKNIYEPEIRSNVDVYFLISVLCLAKRIVKIDQPLYLYRGGRVNSISNTPSEKKFERLLYNLPRSLEYLRKLFQRNDLIGKISYEQQIFFEWYIISNHLHGINLKNIPAEKRIEIIANFDSMYLQRETIENFLQIFFANVL